MVSEIKPPNTEPPQHVTAGFLAKKYKVSDRHIYNLAAGKDGIKIPSVRLGAKCLRFVEADVAKALESNGGAL